MNQHFRNALTRFADDAVVPPELQIANKWIETVVINAFVGGEASSFLPAKRRARDPWDDWSVDFVVHIPGGSFVAERMLEHDNADIGPAQKLLDFPSVFVPSSRLVSLWIDGVAEFAKSGDRKDVDATILKLSTSERSEALIRRISYIVALYAHQRKYEDQLSSVPLAASNRFDLNFQLVLSEFLPLVPDRSDEFLSLLQHELTTAFKAGWNLESEEWGKVKFEGDGIILYMQKPKTFEDPGFELSTEG